MSDTSHYVAIMERIAREKARLESETTEEGRKFRALQVAQAERELEDEAAFLSNRGIDVYHTPENINEDDLAALLEEFEEMGLA